MRARSSEGLRSSTLSQNSKRILDQNIQGQRRKERSTQPSLFTGIIFDAGGNRYSPTHTNKNGCRYRYYTSRAAIDKTKRLESPARIPAPGLEKATTERILSFLNTPSELLAVLENNVLDDEDAPPSGVYAAVVEQAAKTV